MNSPLTSRKTEREVRLRLDRLDEVLLRKIIREELEAHEARKCEPLPGYVGYLNPLRCECGKFNICVGFGTLGCGR